MLNTTQIGIAKMSCGRVKKCGIYFINLVKNNQRIYETRITETDKS